jgi:hypothetical protein
MARHAPFRRKLAQVEVRGCASDKYSFSAQTISAGEDRVGRESPVVPSPTDFENLRFMTRLAEVCCCIITALRLFGNTCSLMRLPGKLHIGQRHRLTRRARRSVGDRKPWEDPAKFLPNWQRMPKHEALQRL